MVLLHVFSGVAGVSPYAIALCVRQLSHLALAPVQKHRQPASDRATAGQTALLVAVAPGCVLSARFREGRMEGQRVGGCGPVHHGCKQTGASLTGGRRGHATVVGARPGRARTALFPAVSSSFKMIWGKAAAERIPAAVLVVMLHF